MDVTMETDNKYVR